MCTCERVQVWNDALEVTTKATLMKFDWNFTAGLSLKPTHPMSKERQMKTSKIAWMWSDNLKSFTRIK